MTGRTAAALIALFCLTSCGREAPPALLLASTSSMVNSGLLDRVLPEYRPRVVRAAPVGSGRALDLLGAGQADVVISHAPEREQQALRSHPTWWYCKILYNDFLIVGPDADPAGTAGSGAAAIAMKRIAQSGQRFISRGDQSGTHEREGQLWEQAGVAPQEDRLIVAGAGMGQTLRIASETGAYTLTDRGTFEALAKSVKLRVLVQGDPALVNTYSVIADPANASGLAFAQWLARGEGRNVMQTVLDAGQVKGFTVWPPGSPSDQPDARPSGHPFAERR